MEPQRQEPEWGCLLNAGIEDELNSTQSQMMALPLVPLGSVRNHWTNSMALTWQHPSAKPMVSLSIRLWFPPACFSVWMFLQCVKKPSPAWPKLQTRRVHNLTWFSATLCHIANTFTLWTHCITLERVVNVLSTCPAIFGLGSKDPPWISKGVPAMKCHKCP